MTRICLHFQFLSSILLLFILYFYIKSKPINHFKYFCFLFLHKDKRSVILVRPPWVRTTGPTALLVPRPASPVSVSQIHLTQGGQNKSPQVRYSPPMGLQWVPQPWLAQAWGAAQAMAYGANPTKSRYEVGQGWHSSWTSLPGAQPLWSWNPSCSHY